MKIIYLKIFIILIVQNAFSQVEKEYFLFGSAKIILEQYDSAILYLNKLISFNDQDENYYLKLGEAYYKKSDFQSAKEAFLEADAIKEKCADLWLSKCYARFNDNDNAFSHLKSYLTLDNKENEKAIKTDEAFNSIQYLDEWFDLWQQEWYPPEKKIKDDIDYLIQKNNFFDALDLIDNNLKQTKNPEILYEYRGDINFKQGIFNVAVMDYTEAIKKDRINSYLYFKRGKAYLKIGKFEDAINDFKRVIRFQPNNFDAYIERASAFESINQYENAVDDLEFYMNFFPQNKEIKYQCGMLHLKNKNNITALKYFNSLLEFTQSNPKYFKARGEAYMKSNIYKFALDDFSMALDLNPRDGETYLLKGLANFQLGNKEEACEDWKKAVELKEKKAIEFLIDNCDR